MNARAPFAAVPVAGITDSLSYLFHSCDGMPTEAIKEGLIAAHKFKATVHHCGKVRSELWAAGRIVAE